MPTKKRNTPATSFHFPSIAICTIGITLLLALRRHLPKEEYKKRNDSRTNNNNGRRPWLSHQTIDNTNVPLLVLFLGAFVGIVSLLYYCYRHDKFWMEADKEKTRKRSKKRTPSTDCEYKSITNQDVLNQLGKLLGTFMLLLTKETDNKTEEIVVLEQKILKLFQILIRKCGDKRSQKRDPSNWNQRVLRKSNIQDESLELISQQAAFAVLNYYPYCDEITSSCFSLLALIAKDESVRQRILQHSSSSSSTTTNTTYPSHYLTTDCKETIELVLPNNSTLLLNVSSYSIAIPIQAMRESLRRAKIETKQEESTERISAELQRKGCVFLGALADGNSDIVVSIIQAGGLDVVLEAVDWFRFLPEVANWSLWTIFIFTYHFPPTFPKMDLFFSRSSTTNSAPTTSTNNNGLSRICRVMKDIPKSMDVQRHGVAILFDVLREVVTSENSTAIHMQQQMRIVAIMNAGVYSAVQSAMINFPNCSEIQLMGTQILEHLPIQ